MHTQNLRLGLTALGVFFLLVGCCTAAYLYQSFGFTPPERVLYGLVGVLLALTGGLLLPAAVALWRAERPAFGVGVGALWLVALAPLTVQSHLGFFTLSQADLAQASLPAQAERARLAQIETALAQVGTAAAYDVSALQAQAEALRAEMSTQQQKLDACPSDYYSKCINPLRATLAELRGRLEPLQQQLQAQAQYRGLQGQRTESLHALATVSTGASAAGVHPLFVAQGRLAHLDAGQAQAVFLAYSATVVEVLTALLFVIAESLKAGTPPGPPLEKGGSYAPAYRDGGAVYHTGVGVLHGSPEQPEFVLSAAATQALGTDFLDRLNATLTRASNSRVAPAPNPRVGEPAANSRVTPTPPNSRVAPTPPNPRVGEPAANSRVVYRDLTRVPAHLSGAAGVMPPSTKARVGRLDTCCACGQDYPITAHNQIRCTPCSVEHKQGFAKAHGRAA